MNLLIIFPCYNEEATLNKGMLPFFNTFEQWKAQGIITPESKICFVDDGSKDQTWPCIEGFKQPYILGIKLSTNFGHQKALVAGLTTFKDQFEGYITLDVDLQDDYTVIPEMIEAYNKGFQVVYGVRDDRTNDSFFKRKTATTFYKLMQLMGVKTVFNHADFRLVSHKALQLFLQFPEKHLFLRAMFPAVGLPQTQVFYKRAKRAHGESKYPLKKMLSFAWDGVTSFTDAPLKWVTFIGAFSILVSLLLLIWAGAQWFLGNTITGWFSVIALIVFFGGLQTFAIGIIGSYVGKIFIQSKNRPTFLIEKIKK